MLLRLLLTLTTACSMTVQAGFIKWESHRAFVSNYYGTAGFVEENFHGIANGTSLRGQMINGITYLAPFGIGVGTNPDSRIRVGIQNSSGAVDGFTTQTLHIQFQSPVQAFGILAYEDHQGQSGRSVWDLQVSNAAAGIALFSTQITDTPAMTWNSAFLGISNTSATDFRLRRTFSDFNTPWSLFEITYLAAPANQVPEPTTALIWFISLLGILAVNFRRNIKRGYELIG